MASGVGGSRPHIPALDGLRGLAVLGILLFHAGVLAGGWLGVDLFFVLSGFLITQLLLDEFERSGAISLAGFWARWARRLLPALLLLLYRTACTSARPEPPWRRDGSSIRSNDWGACQTDVPDRGPGICTIDRR